MNIQRILFAITVSLPLLPFAAAGKADGKDYTIIPGKWEVRNAVNKRFDTPLGVLYQFDPIDSFSLKEKFLHAEKHQANCRCPQCAPWHSMSSLQCIIPRKAQGARYLAIDFIVRQFPAFENAENRNFDFVITQSDNSAISGNYLDLNSQLYSHLERYESIYQNPVLTPDSLKPALIVTGKQYRPKYEPWSIRIIFDNESNGPVYVIINGQRLFVPKYEGMSTPRLPFYAIGFCVQKSMKMPVVNIELSPPRLAAFDREEVLLSFLDDRFQPYPYSAYDLKPQAEPREKRDLRKMRNSQNPDFHYATAMCLLYGTDPEQPLDPEAGVKLLKRAMRDDHVFAIYQLGVCYLRGLGVNKDYAKALKFFEKVAEAGYTPASSMAALALLREHAEEVLVSAKTSRQIEKFLSPSARLDDYCIRADQAYLGLLSGVTGDSLEYSYRQLWTLAMMPNYEYENAARGDTVRQEIYEKSISRFGNTVFPKSLSIRLEANENEKNAYPARAEKALRDDHYAPAGYALAQYWSFQNGYPPRSADLEPRIDRVLAESAAGGFLPAVLMQYERALAAGRPGPKLTPQFELAYADEPWFLFLRFAEKHPEHPTVKMFLKSRDRDGALELLKNDATPDGGYLRGLLTLMHPNGPLGTTEQRIKLDKETGEKLIYLPETFALFVPSLPGNPDACYLIGKLLLQNPDLLPSVPELREKPAQPLHSGIMIKSTAYLQKAAEAGNPKARYLLAKCESSPTRALEILKPLRDAGVIEAWLLTAEIQTRQYGFATAVPAYQQAAALGSPDAYSVLALNTADPVKKRALWQSFLTAEKRKSLLDPLDTYSPKKELRQNLINSDLLYNLQL